MIIMAKWMLLSANGVAKDRREEPRTPCGAFCSKYMRYIGGD